MKKHSGTILLVLIFFVGLAVMLYPTISDYINQRNQTRVVNSYAQQVDGLSDADYTAYFDAADVFNQKIAADPDARGRGVMVVLNDRIGAARFVTKTNATSLDTFRAPEEGYLGVVVGGKPQFETRVDKIHTLRSVFDVRQLKVLPKVVIIYGYQDDPEYMYDAAIAHHADGIIYAGTGAGSVSVRSAAGIKKAQQAGIVVVRASRTGSGVVPPDDSQPGLVADSLNPAKARILLMTALTQTKDPQLIQQYFHTY